MLDDDCTLPDAPLVRLLPALRACGADRLPVVVLAGKNYEPDFSARARNSSGELLQRIWPAFPVEGSNRDPNMPLWFADLLGGQILRPLRPPAGGGPDFRDDVCNYIGVGLGASGAQRMPPGHQLAMFPRSIPSPEFRALLLAAGSESDRSLLQAWFAEDARGGDGGTFVLRKVDEVIDGYLEGHADLEWRNVCVRIRTLLGQAALRALAGESSRARRSLYVTGFDVACPQCLSDSTAGLEPFFFNRDDVLALWRTSSLKTATCPKGHLVGLEEILRPDCFLSYSWGPWNKDPNLAFPTQKLVQQVKAGIENSTATEEMPGLMCWFDLERMKGNSQQAMRDGVEQSGLVVIFLDMAYLKSAACNTELTAARQKGKHIVPIVLPGFDPAQPFRDTAPAAELDHARIVANAALLNPSAEDVESNVSKALFVADLPEGQDERVEAIANHIVEVVLRRTCRDTLISGVGFASRNQMAKEVAAASVTLKFLRKVGAKSMGPPETPERTTPERTSAASTPDHSPASRFKRSWKRLSEAASGKPMTRQEAVSIHKEATRMGLWGPEMIVLRTRILDVKK